MNYEYFTVKVTVFSLTVYYSELQTTFLTEKKQNRLFNFNVSVLSSIFCSCMKAKNTL